MKKDTILKYTLLTLTILVNVFIIVNACINGTVSSQESGWFSKTFASVINFFSPNYINDSNFDNFASIIRKLIGHFGLFAVDGFVSTFTAYFFLKGLKSKANLFFFLSTLLLGLLVASISEFIQIFTPDRFGSFIDILIDFGGYLLGFGIAISILLFEQVMPFKNTENI